jgi:pyruvate dehydrogenase E1 component alpha subunit
VSTSSVGLQPTRPLSRLADDDLEALLLIRHFELAVLDLFAAGQLRGTTHTCLGQEYVPVSLRPYTAEAFVMSNHRGHGHYLARFPEPAGLLAEILGREGALCGGIGGSQHLYRDGFCSTGVQGESVPVALGVAVHLASLGRGGIALAYVGDGSWGAGALYEALNMASLWRAPLVVVVENNGIAQSTPLARHLAGSIAGRAAAFDVRYEHIDTIDINDIRTALDQPIGAVRRGAGPLVVEFDTVRLGPHSKGDDTRPAEVLATLPERDWYRHYARTHPEQFHRWDERCRQRIEATVRDVLAAPPVAP